MHGKARMNITILQGAFLPVPPLMGGAVEKMWFILGQKFVARGHQVTHVSKHWGDLPSNEQIQDVQHVRVSGFDTPASLLALKLLDAVFTLRAIKMIPKHTDIIVTNTFWAPMIVPLFRRAKIYVDVARMPKGQMRFYGRAQLRANSTPVADAIRTELPANRHWQVSMVPNPLPYEVSVSEASELADFSHKQRSILYCGRIHPEKGLELLAKAANALPDGWQLTIVGPSKTTEGGGGEDYLQSLKADFDASKVRFLDPIYNIQQLNALYKAAAIFVYPSVAEKGETFGLAPLEAMAWGTVPVVSDLACFKDFIIHEKNGLIFNHRAQDASEQLMQCTQRLINDATLINQLAKAALNVSISHSPERIADLFLADFKNLLS
jgi:glycosyltransferase involved in cell wall biosynthesis